MTTPTQARSQLLAALAKYEAARKEYERSCIAFGIPINRDMKTPDNVFIEAARALIPAACGTEEK